MVINEKSPNLGSTSTVCIGRVAIRFQNLVVPGMLLRRPEKPSLFFRLLLPVSRRGGQDTRTGAEGEERALR